MVASQRLRIRLSWKPYSKPHKPIFAIKVATCHIRRDGKCLDLIGKYNVHPDRLTDGRKHLEINFERAKYWLAQGAEPTPRVAWLFSKAGLLPPIPSDNRAYDMNSYLRNTNAPIEATTTVPVSENTVKE